MKRSRIWILLSAALVVLALGVACSSETSNGASDGAPAVLENAPEGRPAGEPDNAIVPDSEEPAGGDSLGSTGDTATGGAPNPAGLQTSLDRKIVQSSSIDIEVDEVGREFQELVNAAEASGGFVLNSTFSNSGDDQVADVTIRVPADRYQEVLTQIRGMGKVQAENSNASDVTEEYTDLESRMRQLRAEERQYLELLNEAQNVEQILLVQDRLNSVIGQIEQVQGRINLLDNLSDLATITVHLRPVAAAASGDAGLDPIEAAQNAWEASLDTLRALAVVVVAIVAYSWWLVPVAALGYFGVRWYTGRRPQPPTSASA